MTKKADRGTAVYESKAFPYFTINVAPPHPTAGNRGGIMAFLERLEFVKRYSVVLDEARVFVNTDCGFHCEEKGQHALLNALIADYLLQQIRSLSWDLA